MKIRLYLLDVNRFEDNCKFAEAYERMSPDRRSKIDRMRFDKDKRLCLGAGVVTESIVGDYGLCGDTAAIEAGPHGKPHFISQPDLHFNLSHSGHFVLGIAAPFQCGCDIEATTGDGSYRSGTHTAVEQINSCEENPLCKKVLTQEENELVKSEKDFKRLWTLKESFLKTTGEGITRDMRSFSVAKAFGVHEGQTVRIDGESFFLLELPELDGHVMSCCVRAVEEVRAVQNITGIEQSIAIAEQNIATAEFIIL